MSLQPRGARIFAALLISMTAGAAVLMILGNNPPSAGAFCLSRYHHLDSVEKAISLRTAQLPSYWSGIEIYYSGTKAGNIEQLALLSGLSNPKDIDCHFVVCNGLGGDDGQIQSTEKWQTQYPIIPTQARRGSRQTIRICIIANGKTTRPTDFQIKRVEALAELLCRKFNIQSDSIQYPENW